MEKSPTMKALSSRCPPCPAERIRCEPCRNNRTRRIPELSKKARRRLTPFHGAVKTGKALAGAAKGAAVGGPYGAAAIALWQNRKTIVKILVAVGFLLFLPILFLLMLPSMIFGGLDSVTGTVLTEPCPGNCLAMS